MSSLDHLLDALRQQYADDVSEATRLAQRQVTSQLNEFLRRLRQYSAEAEFTRAVVDGALLFAPAAAFFTVEGASVSLRAQKGFEWEDGLKFPLDDGRALVQAVSGREVVVAMRTAFEVGSLLAASDRTERAVILPVENTERVAALLVAAGEVKIEGLDLIAAVASLVLSRKTKQSGLAELKPVAPSGSANFPPWGALNEQQRSLHWRAQRFSRVKVAEWLLSKQEAGRAGLEQNDIYLFLKKEIDTAREAFRNQFMQDRSMIDYLHAELVSAAAEGDESKLGPDYPGPLV